MSYVTHTIIDHSGELSFTRHHLPAITAANYANVTGNATPGVQNVASLRVALGAVTDGNFVKHEVTAVEAASPPGNAASPQAQRETKMLMRYTTAGGRRWSVEIPCPDLATLAQEGTDLVDITDADFVTLNNLLEASFVDSYGDSLTLLDARIVGRRL